MRTYNLKGATNKRATPTLGLLLGRLKDRIETAQVLDVFNLKKSLSLQLVASEWKGLCPVGHSSASQQSFNLNDEDGLYHCWNCGIGGDIIDLVSVTENVGLKEAAKLISEKLVPDLLPEFAAAEDALPAEERALLDRGKLYRLVYEEGKRQLLQPIGKPVMDYLTQDRGYDPTKIPNTEWIFWDTDQNVRQYLTAKLPSMTQQIQDLDLQGGFGDNFRLALPYRNRHGIIVGFLKRALQPKGITVHGKSGIRWDSTKGLKKSDLFGLHRIRNIDELVVVEGYPDAAYLPAIGIGNIVSFGQAAFSESYVEGLRARGIKRLILALDNDPANPGEDPTGTRNTEHICRLFAESDIRVFVVDPPLLGSCKDPDEYVKANGVDAFKSLVDKAQVASSWMAKRILAKHDPSTDLGREKAISESLEYADSLSNPREAEAVLKALSTAFTLSDELLVEEYKRLQEKKASERLNEGIAVVSREAQRLIANGSPDKAVKILQNDMTDLQNEFWRAKEPVRESLDEFLAEKKRRDSARKQGDRIGYELKDFAEIDKVICGVQSGLYVIAADPNVGKTALMVSLMMDVLHSNSSASCLFYSMDDSRDAIVNRMLAHACDMRINEVRYKLADAAQQKTLDDGYLQLDTWYREGRLDIRESSAHMTMSRIQDEIRRHEKREKLVVFIDGLYNVPVDTDYRSIREENVDRANEVKQLVRLFNIPVIATAEFRKQGREESNGKMKERTIHDIMESGKYGYNADLVILLSPKDAEDYVMQDEPIVIADFGKNKLESFRGRMEFRFIRAKSVMTYVANSKTNS